METLALDLSTPVGIAMITVIFVSIMKHLVLKRVIVEFRFYREIILGITAVSCGVLCILSRYITPEGETQTWYTTIALFLAAYAASIAGFETVGKRIETMLTDWLTPKTEAHND